MPAVALISSTAVSYLWATAVVVLTGIVAISTITPENDWHLREFSDAMVMTHLFGIIPITLALYLKMPLTASVITLSTLASLAYHITYEPSEGAVMMSDAFMASFMSMWLLTVFCVSLTMKPNWHVIALALTFTVLAMVVYGLASKDDDMLPKKALAHCCLRRKLHPLWHILGFISIILVLVNFKRHGNVYISYSKNRWLREMQAFSY